MFSQSFSDVWVPRWAPNVTFGYLLVLKDDLKLQKAWFNSHNLILYSIDKLHVL